MSRAAMTFTDDDLDAVLGGPGANTAAPLTFSDADLDAVLGTSTPATGTRTAGFATVPHDEGEPWGPPSPDLRGNIDAGSMLNPMNYVAGVPDAAKGLVRSVGTTIGGMAQAVPAAGAFLNEGLGGAEAITKLKLAKGLRRFGMEDAADKLEADAMAVLDNTFAASRGVQQAGQPAQEWGQAVAAGARNDPALRYSPQAQQGMDSMQAGDTMLPSTPQGVMAMAGEQGAPMAAALAGGVVAGPAGAVVGGGLAAFGSTYEQAMQAMAADPSWQGRPREEMQAEAARRAIQSAVIEGGTGRIPVEEMLGGPIARRVLAPNAGRAASAAVRGGTSAAEEFTQEGGAEVLGAVGDYASGDPNAFKGLPDRVLQAGVAGAVIGGGPGTVGGFVSPGGTNGVRDAQLPAPAAVPARDQGAGAPADAVETPDAVGAVAADVPGADRVGTQAAAVDALTNPEATEAEVLAALEELEGVTTLDAEASTLPASPAAQQQAAPEEPSRTPGNESLPQQLPPVSTEPARPQPEGQMPELTSSAPARRSPGSSPSQTVQESLTSPNVTPLPPADNAIAAQAVDVAAQSEQGVKQPKTLAEWQAEARRLGVSPKGSLGMVQRRVRAAQATATPSPSRVEPASPSAVAAPEATGGAVSVSRPGMEASAAQSASPTVPPAGERAHKHSSTQVQLPPGPARRVKRAASKIAEADLAADGRETDPHITVKYGLNTDDASQVEALLADQPPIKATLGETSLFSNDDADVVKVDVESPELHALNKKIADAVDHTDTHPDYKPHVTLAYVKPGAGKKYAGDASLKGQAVTLDRLVFSDRDGKKTEFKLGGTPTLAAKVTDGQSPQTSAAPSGVAASLSSRPQSRSGGSRSRGRTQPATPATPRPASPEVAGVNTSGEGTPELRLISRLDQYPDTQAAKDKAKPKGSDPRRRGAALNPIEEVADMLRRAKAQGRKSAAGPARDVAKVEARGARQAARALRRAEASAARLYEQLGESEESRRAYRDVLKDSRRDLNQARQDIVNLSDKYRAAETRIATLAEARDMVTKIAQTIPVRLRGKLITDIRDAATIADVYLAATKARDAVAREIGRDARKVLGRYTGRKVKGRLSDDARAKLADIELKAADAIRRFEAPLASAGDAAVELADLADQAKAVVHEYRLENKWIRLGQFLDADAARHDITQTLSAKKPLPLAADGKGREQPGIITTLFRGNMNALSIAKTLDGFKDGPVSMLMQDIQDGQSRRFELTEAATMQADAAANKAGFENLSHLMAATSDLLGEGPTVRQKVTLAGKEYTLTLGELAKLYSTEQDVNTRALIAAGKPVQFRAGGKFSDPVRLTPNDFQTVADALPQEIKAAVDSMKATRDRMFPAVQKVIRTLKGYEPPKEPGYEPRYVNRELSGASTDAELAPDLSGQIEKHLENAGFTIERVQDKTNPLVIGDFFHDWARSINGQADVIALATPIANARKILLHPTTKQAIADRYGDAATKRIREILIDAAGLRADPGSVTAVVQRLTRNVSYARTALRPTSWLIQGAGVPRLAAEMPGSAFAAGLRGAFSPELGRRMMEGSPMLRKRYSGTLASINTSLGDPSTAIAPHGDETFRDSLGIAARAGKAVAQDIAKGDVGGVVNKALPELFDTIRISNFFDSIPARIAWAGFEAEAARTGKDAAWVRQQAEAALSKVLNSSDPLHLTAYGSRFRNTPLVPFTAFTSDAASAWNQVYQGWGESRTKGMKTTAGVLAGSLWAAAITGVSGYLGMVNVEDKDEEDAQKEALRRAATRFLQETVGMGFVEGKLADVIDASIKGFDVNVADAPMIGAVNQTIRAVHGLSTAIYDRLASEDPAKVETASRRFVDALARIVENAGALAGNPLTPAVGAGRKAIKAEMEETGKELREKKKEATGDDGTTPEEALGRRQLFDAMASGGDPAKAFATLREAGVRLNRANLESLVEAKNPLRGMKPGERVKYLRSLSPAARAEHDRQVERYRAARRAVPKTLREYRRAR